jgi:hypothetical protein
LEINKQLKGGVINIYPLETLNLIDRYEAKQILTNVEAKPITDYVSLTQKADQRLVTLVHNIFHNVFMVKDYPLAL